MFGQANPNHQSWISKSSTEFHLYTMNCRNNYVISPCFSLKIQMWKISPVLPKKNAFMAVPTGTVATHTGSGTQFISTDKIFSE